MDSMADVIHMLTAAVADSQMAITDGSEEVYTGRNTTLNIGVALEIDLNWVEKNSLNELNDIRSEFFPHTIVPTKWVYSCVNIGDCKVLHISYRSRIVTDVTVLSRPNKEFNPTDPGGRLGAYNGEYIKYLFFNHYFTIMIEKCKPIFLLFTFFIHLHSFFYHVGVWPDDRNIAAFWLPVEEGDIIVCMSDGVHDNLDPEIQGLSPSDFDLQFSDWDEMPSAWAIELKKLYLSYFVQDLLGDILPLTPQYIKNTLIDFCKTLTETSRYLII